MTTYKRVWDAPLNALKAAKDTYDARLETVRIEESKPYKERVESRVQELRETVDKRFAEADAAGVPVKYIAESAGLSRNRVYEILKKLEEA